MMKKTYLLVSLVIIALSASADETINMPEFHYDKNRPDAVPYVDYEAMMKRCMADVEFWRDKGGVANWQMRLETCQQNLDCINHSTFKSDGTMYFDPNGGVVPLANKYPDRRSIGEIFADWLFQ